MPRGEIRPWKSIPTPILRPKAGSALRSHDAITGAPIPEQHLVVLRNGLEVDGRRIDEPGYEGPLPDPVIGPPEPPTYLEDGRN